MSSSKQRRETLRARRAAKAARAQPEVAPTPEGPPPGSAPVDHAALAPNNSYGQPDWERRGYYLDTPFRCADCGADQVWTAAQQKWWFEVAKGFAYARAKRCHACRLARRAARDAARAASAAGRVAKADKLAARAARREPPTKTARKLAIKQARNASTRSRTS